MMTRTPYSRRLPPHARFVIVNEPLSPQTSGPLLEQYDFLLQGVNEIFTHSPVVLLSSAIDVYIPQEVVWSNSFSHRSENEWI